MTPEQSLPAERLDPLFPEIEPHASGRLSVDARHTLY